MDRIAKFEKVSKAQFSEQELIKLPVRATAGSAGYDIITPHDIILPPGQSLTVATGLRCRIKEGWVLFILPKSGLGFKYRVQLDNTVGVIDSDYYNADNEGHIMVRITNDGKIGKTLHVEAGKAFAQGVFLPFGITEDDEVTAERHGGFGSTNA